jgi:hypothetical protein
MREDSVGAAHGVVDAGKDVGVDRGDERVTEVLRHDVDHALTEHSGK